VDDGAGGGWSSRTWRIALALALASGVAVGTYASAQRDDPEPTSCPSDALLGQDGQPYGRAGSDCHLVDAGGKPVLDAAGDVVVPQP
jgi:hypothetical protein